MQNMEKTDKPRMYTSIFKHHFRPLIMRAVLSLFSWLPLSLNHRLGALIGRLSYAINNSIQRVARINIQHCYPDMEVAEQELLIKDYLIETGKTLTETGVMWLQKEKQILNKIKAVSGEELLQAAFEAGQGVILAAPHMGCWEIIGHYCSSHYPMTCMYRPQKTKLVDHMVRTGRTRFGMKLARTDASGIKQLIQALRSGEMVGILPDQVPQPGQGVFSNFFGSPAYSTTLLPRLAKKTGARVIFTFAERLSNAEGYHIHFLPAADEIYHPQLEHSVTAMNHGVEQCIQLCPQQYQWGYKRFKIRPPGEGSYY
ncbi:MAG: lysophospholipid acyltransferase family protein [Gammaproteobacteria bacterium]|nr:lysophospholipid acyltransferase family protein [Gammaproteobacteria bacterium]